MHRVNPPPPPPPIQQYRNNSLGVVHPHGEELAPELPVGALERPLLRRLRHRRLLVEVADVEGLQDGVCGGRVEGREDVGEVIARVGEDNVATGVLTKERETNMMEIKRRYQKSFPTFLRRDGIPWKYNGAIFHTRKLVVVKLSPTGEQQQPAKDLMEQLNRAKLRFFLREINLKSALVANSTWCVMRIYRYCDSSISCTTSASL